jgi:hypothetical protein
MQEKLINFKTAQLAKKKGFDISKDLIGSRHGFYLSEGDLILGDSFAKERLFHAPPQSVLQKWLREKQHKFICIMHKITGSAEDFTVQFSYNGVGGKWSDIWFDTYEEALEQALEFALNDIS